MLSNQKKPELLERLGVDTDMYLYLQQHLDRIKGNQDLIHELTELRSTDCQALINYLASRIRTISYVWHTKGLANAEQRQWFVENSSGEFVGIICIAYSKTLTWHDNN
jgi:hypothetical protein